MNGIFGYIDSKDFNRPSQTTEGLINNQNNVLEDYLEIVFTAERSKAHGIYLSLAWSLNSATSDFITQLEISGDQGFSEILTLPVEPTDSAGTGQLLDTLTGGIIGAQENTGTNQINEIDFMRHYDLIAGEVYTLTLRWGATGAGLEAAALTGQLGYIERVTSA